MKIIVGQGSCGIAAGAGKVYNAIEKLKTENDSFKLGITGCIGMCFLEPIVDLYEDETLKARLVHVKEDDAEKIVKAARENSLSEVEDLIIKPEDEDFLNQQTRIALRNCGLIDRQTLKSIKKEMATKR